MKDISKYFWIVWIVLPIFNAYLYLGWFVSSNSGSTAASSEAPLFAVLAVIMTVILVLMALRALKKKS